MKIYLDIILIENIFMNYIILFATGIVMKRKIKHYRLILSSFVGSIYAIIVYMQIMPITSNIVMKIILSITMIYLSFMEKNIKMLLKDLLMFYLISFVFGGCTFALIYFISPENVQIKNGVLVGIYPIKVTLIAGAISFIIIQIAFNITKNKLSKKDIICNIEIFFQEKKLQVTALIDSGNMLKEPISGRPVIVVEMEEMKKILPEELIEILNKILGGDLKNEILEDKYLSKIKLIPFTSLGKQNGMLAGIKIKGIRIIFKEFDEYIKDIIVGVYNKRLTKDNRYNALIGLELLEGSESNEYITNIKR